MSVVLKLFKVNFSRHLQVFLCRYARKTLSEPPMMKLKFFFLWRLELILIYYNSICFLVLLFSCYIIVCLLNI